MSLNPVLNRNEKFQVRREVVFPLDLAKLDFGRTLV